MRKVVIQMQKGKPQVIHCPRNVVVEFKTPKRKGIKKRWRTMIYHLKTFFTDK